MSSANSDTRTRILKAAKNLLERPGRQGVRLGDIARAAGISRQAVYLHFDSRAAVLAATTQYVDELLNVEQRLKKSRSAKSGVDRLDAYIEFWGSYVPEIYGVAKALLVSQETDDAAAAAWSDRMAAMRDGCRAAIEALHTDGMLADEWSINPATDLLWTMLSVRNWEQLTQTCGWSPRQFVQRMKILANRVFVKSQ